MSKFTKVYKKWNDGNNGKYYSAREFHKALMHKFGDWQPPKPLVVVPQFVSDWFDINQDGIDGNIKALTRNIDRKLKIEWSEMDRWFMYSPNKPIETLISMKLYGYTVEKPKEKLYFVKLPGMTALDAHLCKSCSPGEIGYHEVYSSKEPNKISFSSRYDKKYSGGWQRQFTESEIKAIDERYWSFAVPVEEVEP